jgi:hemerythrin
MEFIRWCGLLVIGHPVIDEQHQKLFSIINEFHNQLETGESKHLAVDTLNRLIKFAQKHFAAEEAISKQFGFPDEKLTQHKKIHEQLIFDIFELHQEITSSTSIDLRSISSFLTEWIILHILIEDNKYKNFLPQ